MAQENEKRRAADPALSNEKTEHSVTREADCLEYLDAVLGTTEGTLCASFFYGGYIDDNGKYDHRRRVHPTYQWPAQREEAARELVAASADADVYVAPYVLAGRKRAAGTAVADSLDHWHNDIDKGTPDVDDVKAAGMWAVASGSDGHLHVYGKLTQPVAPNQHRQLCELTRDKFDGDSKISDNDLLRPPGTWNHKGRAAGGDSILVTFAIRPGDVEPMEPWKAASNLGGHLVGVTSSGTSTQGVVDKPAAGTTAGAVIDSAESFDLSEYPKVRAAVDQQSDDRSEDMARIVEAVSFAGLTIGNAVYAVMQNPGADRYTRPELLHADVARLWQKFNPEHVQKKERFKAERAERQAAERAADAELFGTARAHRVVNHTVQEVDDEVDDELKVVAWPKLDRKALHGTAGDIVNQIAPHTEADPAAILVQLLAAFGATLGADTQERARAGYGPYLWVANQRHPAIVNPLIVGNSNGGGKGTGWACVKVILDRALPMFVDSNVQSGLSTAPGLIEKVRDDREGEDENDKNADPGVPDKRLLLLEEEYRQVLARSRRESSSDLGTLLRGLFDGRRQVQVMNRSKNRLTATGAHVVIIGHGTPRELRSELSDNDFSGGNVNRLLITLSKRTKLLPRGGNIPDDVVAECAKLFSKAHEDVKDVGCMNVTEGFWSSWDHVYAQLSRPRPELRASDATARATTMVWRLSMLYALLDGRNEVDVEHLDAARALWSYCEHSARWLFASFEQTRAEDVSSKLVQFIVAAGGAGRSRTEISVDFYQRHATKQQIDEELTRAIHAGDVVEIEGRDTGGRKRVRYYGRELCENANNAGQGVDSPANELANDLPACELSPGDDSHAGDDSQSSFAPENAPDQHNSPIRIIRPSDAQHGNHCGCGALLEAPESIASGKCRACVFEEKNQPANTDRDGSAA